MIKAFKANTPLNRYGDCIMYEKKKWLQFYGNVPETINYPEVSMYEALMQSVEKYSNDIAYDFLGMEATYTQFAEQIDQFADALSNLGFKKGDTMTISMPTSPPAVVAFYAVNKLGGVASMIHPLSTESEIEFYVNISKSKFVLTLDLFCEKLKAVMNKTNLKILIIARIMDYLPIHIKPLFWLKKGRKIPKIQTQQNIKMMKALMTSKYPKASNVEVDTHDLAVIMYSGGTTGKPKGIMLSNYNFISEGLMCANWSGMDRRYPNMLALLPIFHGFGLGVCINSTLGAGGKIIMVPTFEPDKVGEIIKKKKPNYIIGPPTLFSALSRSKSFQNTDLSCLRATISGADTLPKVVKEKFESVVRECNGNVKLLEGYGLTEAVTGIMAMPFDTYREGSIGIPFPDMLAKVVTVDTTNEAKVGEDGEICISGPAVMMGYLDNPEETEKTLQKHDDGRIWLHTGDVGYMDEDGFFYFKLRQKRMIKSSGMNVYPAQVEEQLLKHDSVKDACVIGVPDEKQVEKVKAFIVLEDSSEAVEITKQEIIQFCQKDLIKWSCPREIEFKEELPLTRVGKIAFTVLEKEEKEKLKAAGKYTGE